MIQKNCVGTVELFNRSPLLKDRDWFTFLDTLTGQIVIAIENITLFKGLQTANNNLRSAYNTTIEGWSRALDMRDHETEGHCIRVARTSVELGKKLGLGEQELEALYRGALLHDIGKVAIPDSILLKPGPLTEEEWQIMRLHPQYAHDLLAPIDFLQPSITVPWRHHESWDGSGYPGRLAGKDIPFFARIFALIDVWDALSSDRPYRNAWTPEKVREYIAARSGIQFDPEITRVFLTMDF
jgi:HD-GYP domain-containing protein (c-di-GMP phosphodiesterase class II)